MGNSAAICELQVITPQEAASQKDTHLLLDVRTPSEFQQAHIQGSESHPLGALDASRVASLAKEKSGTILICRSGTRAKMAAEKLAAAGVSNLRILDGGVQAWEWAGLPLVRGKASVISLERQMRIIIGSLVLLGVVLSWAVNPWWLLLSAFMGAGLVFAGVTDYCPLAMGVARMPWNTRGSEKSCCSS
ncbi:MAG: rhodanese-like domain-containing protein [Terrimicrobiaceae bacterium]|nr:rhodanese-like domain-containing protein [Terrimicrobiaceae bacterium]